MESLKLQYASLNGLKVPKRPCFLDTYRPKKGWWSYERFLLHSKLKYGDQFTYPDLNENDPVKSYSQIRFVCKKCLYESETSVSWHLHESSGGCMSCEGRLIWTYKTFHKNAEFHLKELYHNFEYYISREMIKKGSESPLHVRCKTCKRRWFPTIQEHILDKRGQCPFEKVHPSHRLN